MIARANSNATQASITNTTFILSPITSIPLPDGTADCIISNCVINLVPHKEKHVVFSEAFRLLKPGGRFAVSDILAKTEFTEEMKLDMSLYVGCISGAALVEEYETWLRQAGFEGKSTTCSYFGFVEDRN
jgi:arsenite methyltransferase